ncbi:MAG: hypothetical protein K6U00_09550, partial [Armatimonadetes bacterium]|nr:hypothetical protein [Armatimonadota bacterium]
MIHVDIFSVRRRLPARIGATGGACEDSCLERHYRLLSIFLCALAIHDEKLQESTSLQDSQR